MPQNLHNGKIIMKRAFDIVAGIPTTLGGAGTTLGGLFMAAAYPVGLITVAGAGLTALGLITTRLGWRATTQGTNPADGSTTSRGRTMDVLAGIPTTLGGLSGFLHQLL